MRRFRWCLKGFVVMSLAVVLILGGGICSASIRDYQEGYQFGTTNTIQTRQNISAFMTKVKLANSNMSTVRQRALSALELTGKILPEKIDWMKGLSAGAGVPYEDVLIFNCINTRSITGFEGECTTFIAHGKALESGKGVIIAKNRDLGPNTISEVTVQEGSRNPEGTVYKAAYIDIPEVRETYKFVGSRSAGRWGYGMGINEHQVIASDNDAPTRDYLTFKDGLHDNDYIRLILERAKTAREGVEIVTALTEKYGQAWNSIMFEIADPRELWIVEVTGKRWVAKKYEDTVTARSNQFQITDDYDMAAEDLISFAQEQGWIKKGTEKINFRAVYGTYELYPEDNENIKERPAVETLYNTEMRYQRAMELLKAREGKLTMADLPAMMGDHYDTYVLPSGKTIDMQQTPFYSTEHSNTKHEWVGETPQKDTREEPFFIRSICHHGMGGVTASSAILCARPDVPNELGLMLHAHMQPCLSAYVPFYVGISEVDDDFSTPDIGGKFLQIYKMALGHHGLYHPVVRSVFKEYDNNLFADMQKAEKTFVAESEKDPKKAVKNLTSFVEEKCVEVSDLAEKALENMAEKAADTSAWSR